MATFKPSPNWGKWFAKPGWSVADAAALLVGVEPHDPGPYHGPLEDQDRLIHDAFIAAAPAAIGKPPLTSWIRNFEGLPASRNNPVSMVFPPGDLMDFAKAAGFALPAPIDEQFLDLQRSGPTPWTAIPATLTRTAITRIYIRLKKEQWRHLFNRNSDVKACLSPAARPGKPLYSRASIERWLVIQGHYSEAEIQAGITRSESVAMPVRTHRVR